MACFKTPIVFVLLLSVCICTGQADHVRYNDPKQPLNVGIKDLMKRMTLAEKIGQMTQTERNVASADEVQKYFIGSLLSGGESVPRPQAAGQDWVDMVNGFQKGAMSTRLQIPMIYGIDALHGHNNVYNATIFSHNVGLEATSRHVAACAKHYVGGGGMHEGIDENNTVINRHDLLKIHMAPYYDAIHKGGSIVMVSYSSWNGMKMHANRDVVTGYLKNHLKFRGIVISDWQGIDKITSPPHANYSLSVQAGIHAGIDVYQVENKVIPMSRIDDAVRRILRVKFMMGFFEEPYADYSLVNELGSRVHRELAREAVRKSLVLLNNGKPDAKPVLPLDKKAPKILVAGTHADNLGYQCGGWTIQWQGVSGNNETKGTTILSEVKSLVNPKTEVVFEENPDAYSVKKGGFSYAIVAVGELPYAETLGDSINLTIHSPGPSVIQNVCGVVKCVVVIISGRPVVIEPYVSQIDALVAAWFPGTEGQGIADVLFGDYGFTGKLRRTWFKSVDQLPMNFGDKHYDPLFPFGFGLTTSPIIFI